MSDNIIQRPHNNNTAVLFDDLAQALSQRKVPAPPADLSTRIIARAQSKPRKASGPLTRFLSDFQSVWEELGHMLFLPKPGFALVLLLTLGLAISFWTRDVDSIAQTVLPNMTPYDLASFMIIEDRFVAGEWL